MALPERTSFAATHSATPWPLNDDFSLPAPHAEWLLFGVCRALVPGWQLPAAFEVDQGRPRFIPGQVLPVCLVSPPKRGRIRLMQTGCRAIGRPPSDAPDYRHLAQLRLPPWLIGGVLRFRKDRWAFAPRLFSGSHRKLAHMEALEYEQQLEQQPQQQGDDPEGGQAGPYTQQQSQLLWKRSRSMADPFVDLNRLLLFLRLQPFQNRKLACHHGCARVQPACRARCVHQQHLGWGNHLDNSYHAILHNAGQHALERRPQGWLAPSRRPGYNKRQGVQPGTF